MALQISKFMPKNKMFRCIIGGDKSLSRSCSTSFANISKLLAPQEKIEDYDQKSVVRLQTKKVPRKKVNEVVISTPAVLKYATSFRQVLRKSPVFRELVDVEEEAGKVLMKSAEMLVNKQKDNYTFQSEEEDRILQQVEKSFPIEKIDPSEIERSRLNKLTFNVAKIVNESSTLKSLVDLGVNLAHWEKLKMVDIAISLRFNTDVKPKIKFFTDLGIPPSELGDLFTHCPQIFTVDEDDLNSRLNYLMSKNFTRKMILKIIRNSHCSWFTHSILDIDSRLGFFQKSFKLKGSQIRTLAARCPELIIWVGTPFQVNENKTFLISMMGFKESEVLDILFKHPEVFLSKHEKKLQETFEVLHNDVGLSHELLSKFPSVLLGDQINIRGRHEFLAKLGRDQYDPKKPNYISPSLLVESPDDEFCTKAAKVPVRVYNQFLKTL